MKIIESKIIDVCHGANVTIIAPSNIYGCTLDDNVFVGPFCEIQCDVFIGKHTRIQSHSFICSRVHIGEKCFVGHGVMFINDTFSTGSPANTKDLWKQTNIGNNVCIGSNATILPVSICDNVVIGAGAVVTKNITQSGFYIGNPAQLLRPIESCTNNL